MSLAEEKASPFWRALGMLHRSYLTALTGTTAEAVNTITTALTVFRPTGSRMWESLYSAHLSYAHAKVGQFEEASRCIDEAHGECHRYARRCPAERSPEVACCR